VIFSTVLFAKKSPYEEVVKEEEHSYQMVVKRLQHYKKLAKRKTEVKKLYKKNEINQVLALFEMDSKDIDASLAKSDLVISDSLYFDLAVIYKNIAPVKYRLEYYSGLISLLKKNYDKARKSFQDINENSTGFKYKDYVIYHLQYLYLLNNQNEKVLEIFNNYNDIVKSEQIYWMAQAYYNLKSYDKAKKLFIKSSANEKFKLKSEEMLALIDSIENGIDVGIDKFLVIQKHINQSKMLKRNLNFVKLSLARLYFAKKDFIDAEKYYTEYLQLSGDKSSEIMMEVGQFYFNKNDFSKALEYFNNVIQFPESNQYYVSAKYMIAIINARGKDILSASKDIKRELSKIDKLNELIAQKYKLMNEIDAANARIFAANDSVTIIDDRNFIDQKNKELENLNSEMIDLSRTISPKYAKLLHPIEKEYLAFTDILSSLDTNIEKLATTKPVVIPKKLDKEMAILDSEYIQLHALGLISNLKDVQWRDYQLAFAISAEKKWQNEMLQTWKKIRNKALLMHNSDIVIKADKSIKLLNLNLVSLDTISRFYFNNTVNPKLVDQIEEESRMLLANKENLKEIKQLVLKNYHNILIKKIKAKKKDYSKTQKELLTSYNKLIDRIKFESQDQKNRFQTSLFDLLFQRIQNMNNQTENLSKKN
jgi:tetratricopeptide (TPR) repeat protein